MLSKPFRFHGHQSVRRVYQRGRPVRNELGSLHFFTDEKHPRARVAVVVSKKVDKSAVTRNRIRRRIYEIVRTHPRHAEFVSEMVFTIYKVEAATESSGALTREVHDLLERAKII